MEIAGDIVIVHKEKKPRGFCSLGRVEEVLPGRDDQVRSAVVRVFTGGKKSKTIRRPVQRLYPIEISRQTSTATEDDSPTQTNVSQRRKSTREAALEARDRIVAQSLVGKD